MLRNAFITLIGTLCPLICSALDEKQAARYAEALDLRDGKIANLSKEESSVRAAQIFWELAKAGNPNAMHNYGMIQFKQGNYELAYDWFERAGLNASKNNIAKMIKDKVVKQRISLVVNSTRDSEDGVGPLVDAVYGKQVDLSHRTSFEGKATTMDLLPSVLQDCSHIQADACKFDLSSYNVTAALLERPPTMNLKKSSGLRQVRQLPDYFTHNYVGDFITNIASAMRPDAIIEIEWLPYTALGVLDRSSREKCIESNPFLCFFDMNIIFQSVFFLRDEYEGFNLLGDQDKQQVLAMAEKLDSLLKFYHELGVGSSLDELRQTLFYEAYIIFQMAKNNTHVFIDYNPRRQNSSELANSYLSAIYINFSPELIGKSVELKYEQASERGFVYDLSSFLQETFFNFVIENLAVEYNRPYVMAYLDSLGVFDEISLERRTNTHNGRQNVWMVKMRKK